VNRRRSAVERALQQLRFLPRSGDTATTVPSRFPMAPSRRAETRASRGNRMGRHTLVCNMLSAEEGAATEHDTYRVLQRGPRNHNDKVRLCIRRDPIQDADPQPTNVTGNKIGRDPFSAVRGHAEKRCRQPLDRTLSSFCHGSGGLHWSSADRRLWQMISCRALASGRWPMRIPGHPARASTRGCFAFCATTGLITCGDQGPRA